MTSKRDIQKYLCGRANLVSKIAVEPTMWLYMIAYMMTSVIEQEFFLHKSCRADHGFSEEICKNLNQYHEVNKRIQV